MESDNGDDENQLLVSAPLESSETGMELVVEPPQNNAEKKHLLSRIVDLLKSMRRGSDLIRLQVPVELNMPKSQLQLYGESVYCCGNDLLGACAKGTSPLQRFLGVVAWHISTTRVCPIAQAPFNPILGETHHVSCGNLNVFLEQVSHQPPISALYATNEQTQMRLQWWQIPCPQFHGNRVEVNVQGRRELYMDGHKEVYEMTCPNLMIRFFPTAGNEWVGKSTIKCHASDLEAAILFHHKPFFGIRGATGHITGHVFRSSAHMPLFNLSGSYNRLVTIQNIKTGETSVLFDAQASLSNLKALEVQSRKDVKRTESISVWREVMEGIMRRDWECARKAKQEVEGRQRAMAKQRQKEGEPWVPEHFELVGGEQWQWRCVGTSVEPAPLVVP